MMSTPAKWLLYTLAGPTVTRIVPELAVEIGLNESIVLMQISFWLSTCDNLRDGIYWTYQSLRDMKEKAFPYWSIETIRRTILHLEELGYIRVGNYNKRKSDKTQWLALEPDRCSSLMSVLCATSVKGVSKRDSLSQNETPLSQNETPLPENTPENTHKEESSADKPRTSRKEKKDTVPAAQMNPMKDALAAAFNRSWETMTKAETGPMQVTAKELCQAGVSPAEVPSLYAYCKGRFDSFGPRALSAHLSEWREKEAQRNPAWPPGYIPVAERTHPLQFVELVNDNR